MTENKRFTIKPQDDLFGVVDNYFADKVCVINGISTEIEAEWLCKDMNTLNDENEELKTQLQNTSNQRDEFHRGVRENANRVGKLKKENEELKQFINELTSRDGKIWLSSGYVYDVKKVLKGDAE